MKKAILVVSFGTTYHESRMKTIEAIEQSIREEFPEYEVRRAFTSRIIIEILKKKRQHFYRQCSRSLRKAGTGGISACDRSAPGYGRGRE